MISSELDIALSCYEDKWAEFEKNRQNISPKNILNLLRARDDVQTALVNINLDEVSQEVYLENS